MAQKGKKQDCYPVVHSIISGAELGEFVLRDFGLVASDSIRLIQSGFNDHYALRSREGDFVVRVYRKGWRSSQEITWELELIDHLAACSAPVAACIKRTDGRLFSELQAPEGTRQVAVFQRVPGRYTHFGKGDNRISPADCAEQFGRSVAEIHAAADTYNAQAQRFHLDVEHLLDQPLQAIAYIYTHRKRELERLRQLAHGIRHVLDIKRLEADWGPCHGDMSGGNSTYWNGRVLHFDFDCAGPGWRAYDLGVFFWSMSINGHGADVWEQFKHGYSAARALPNVDLTTMHGFAAMRVIWLMGLWCANAHVFGYARLHDDYFDREVARISEFYNQAMQIAEAGL